MKKTLNKTLSVFLLVIPVGISCYAIAAERISGVAPQTGLLGTIVFYVLLTAVGLCLVLSLGLIVFQRSKIYFFAMLSALLGLWSVLALVM